MLASEMIAHSIITFLSDNFKKADVGVNAMINFKNY